MTYWDQRKNLMYYQAVKVWLEDLSAHSLLDVGAKDTPVACWGDYNVRVAIDKEMKPNLPCVQCFQQDIFREPIAAETEVPMILDGDNSIPLWDYKFDVVTCLQTLEHVENPRRLCRTLFDLATKAVVITIPYRWDFYHEHLHHKLDMKWFISVAESEPDYLRVINDSGIKRLIGVWDVSN